VRVILLVPKVRRRSRRRRPCALTAASVEIRAQGKRHLRHLHGIATVVGGSLGSKRNCPCFDATPNESDSSAQFSRSCGRMSAHTTCHTSSRNNCWLMTGALPELRLMVSASRVRNSGCCSKRGTHAVGDLQAGANSHRDRA